jgi:acetolactate synthase-1/3 small subunit
VGNDETVEQIKKQLNKLIDVVKLIDLSESFSLERELALLKVKKTDVMVQKIENLSAESLARVTDDTDDYLIIELTGEKVWLDDFLSSVEDEVLEVVRTGVIGLSRGERSLTV